MPFFCLKDPTWEACLSHGGHVHGGAGGLSVLGPPEAGHGLDLGEELHASLAVEVQVTADGG